jgi:hypothetical protein
VQSENFRNLKKRLRVHLTREKHSAALRSTESKDLLCRKEETRNKLVGQRLGKICYFNFKNGRPDYDYPPQVLIHSSFGTDVGDLNHSKNFPPKLLPHVAAAVRSKLENYFDSNLLQTNYKPPIKIIADKVTWKHRTQQLIGAVIVVPDSEAPIQALLLGAPVVDSGHRGVDIAQNITGVVDKFIRGSQYRGTG